MNVTGKLTVYFEEPFWVGIFEREELNTLMVSRVVFGAEPREVELLEWVNKLYIQLRFTKPIKTEKRFDKKINPKRLQRQVRQESSQQGIGTKAQQALKLEQESKKVERKTLGKAQREALEKEHFIQKQLKKKQKKRGH